jgi:hypothetical protein
MGSEHGLPWTSFDVIFSPDAGDISWHGNGYQLGVLIYLCMVFYEGKFMD